MLGYGLCSNPGNQRPKRSTRQVIGCSPSTVNLTTYLEVGIHISRRIHLLALLSQALGRASPRDIGIQSQRPNTQTQDPSFPSKSSEMDRDDIAPTLRAEVEDYQNSKLAETRENTLGNVRLRHHETNEIILVPTPSNDPNDPLNW